MQSAKRNLYEFYPNFRRKRAPVLNVGQANNNRILGFRPGFSVRLHAEQIG